MSESNPVLGGKPLCYVGLLLIRLVADYNQLDFQCNLAVPVFKEVFQSGRSLYLSISFFKNMKWVDGVTGPGC